LKKNLEVIDWQRGSLWLCVLFGEAHADARWIRALDLLTGC